MKRILLSAYACIPDRGSEEGNGWNYSSLMGPNAFHFAHKQRWERKIIHLLETYYDALPNPEPA